MNGAQLRVCAFMRLRGRAVDGKVSAEARRQVARELAELEPDIAQIVLRAWDNPAGNGRALDFEDCMAVVDLMLELLAKQRGA